MKNIQGVKLVATLAVIAVLTSSCAFFGHKGSGHKNERHERQYAQSFNTSQSKD
ncbi:hypothetical protein [Paraglaciecola sp. 2405UD69-4]|uniref:hypothetical protein n=1 Tax=Paraglaciecola sp. 2405UD69-4 TaxID=3391836 RepID=UPI0039C9ABAD